MSKSVGARKKPSTPTRTFSFPSSQYRFREWAQEALGWHELHKLHESDAAVHANQKETYYYFVRQLESAFSGIETSYIEFIQGPVSLSIGGHRAYQRQPTFRVHLHGMSSISAFHKDRDYGLCPGAINIWIPLVDVSGNNSLWIESMEDAGDFAPLDLQYGQFAVFDAANLCHGSKMNDSGISRISFDVRLLPDTPDAPLHLSQNLGC